MNEKARVAILIAELHGDAEVLSGLAETNLKADGRIRHGATDELDWAALGYTIHNIYNALESYFLRVPGSSRTTSRRRHGIANWWNA